MRTRALVTRPLVFLVALVVAPAAARLASAQTDEIQVYDASLTAPGTLNLTVHNNFTPKGIATPSFPGAVVSDKSLNGVPEWAYGIVDWLEGGLYLPLYSIGNSGTGTRPMLNGAKLRILFAVPGASGRRFFYGANFEFSYNARHWSPTRFASELRPIVGWHFRRVDVVVNPILDTDYTGARNITFAPCARVAYNFADSPWSIAAEQYADVGPLHAFNPLSRQFQQIYAVVDRRSRALDIEAGIGFGLTGGSDRLTLKLMLSRDLR